ncbi:MAG: Smr/MutS family protein [Opitutales bacterium]
MAQDDPDNPFGDEPVEVPIDGTLDLHHFHPSEVKDVTRAYLEACQEKGILDVRVVHGKGTGALRETIHAQLRKWTDIVEKARLGDEFSGGWGATRVKLKPLGEPES